MRPIVIVRTFVILIAVLGIIFAGKFLYKDSVKQELPYFSTVPEFQFVTQDSLPFGLENMHGKVNVVDFMFTRCKGPCPIMVNMMGDLYSHFENQKMVQFVSVSVDPEYDTLLALQAYADKNGVDDDRWVFLSAPMPDIVKLCEQGFKLAADDLPGAHSTKFILVDSDGKIRGYYSGIDKEDIVKLQHDIESLL